MISDDQVWMILGHNERHGALVAVIVGADSAERAKQLYATRHPDHMPLSWPRLSDLQKSVLAMEHARDGIAIDMCPVIRDELKAATPTADAAGPSLPCPVSVLRVLDMIRSSLEKRGFDDPFDNTAAAFRSSIFSAMAYRWEPEESPGVFRWRDLEVTWYKRLHRCPTINRIPASEELDEMLAECRAAIALARAPIGEPG
jgi:hypothetical protein